MRRNFSIAILMLMLALIVNAQTMATAPDAGELTKLLNEFLAGASALLFPDCSSVRMMSSRSASAMVPAQHDVLGEHRHQRGRVARVEDHGDDRERDVI